MHKLPLFLLLCSQAPKSSYYQMNRDLYARVKVIYLNKKTKKNVFMWFALNYMTATIFRLLSYIGAQTKTLLSAVLQIAAVILSK